MKHWLVVLATVLLNQAAAAQTPGPTPPRVVSGNSVHFVVKQFTTEDGHTPAIPDSLTCCLYRPASSTTAPEAILWPCAALPISCSPGNPCSVPGVIPVSRLMFTHAGDSSQLCNLVCTYTWGADCGGEPCQGRKQRDIMLIRSAGG